MGITLRWVGEEDYERVAQARMLSYAPATSTFPRYLEALHKYRRAKPGDFLLAERNGEAVGTVTSLSLTMWMRGAAVPCQGVAYVGTIKTARRAGAGGEKGIATQLMFETLRKARERQQVVSALMPFRASYYEHFGYGNAERRVEWTVPMSILPRGDLAGFRFYREGDLPLLMQSRQRECQAGQCDIETNPEAWEFWMSQWPESLVVVDQPSPRGPIHALVVFDESRDGPAARLRVQDWSADSPAALLRILCFLGSLKDQYTDISIALPGDYALNRVLRESQLPHRQVDHPVAAARPYTRMQIRVLDHRRLLSALNLPPAVSGKATIAVRECEGDVSRFAMDVSDGRIAVSPSSQSPDVELSDVLWASIVSGDLSATQAIRLGLLPAGTKPQAVDLLDAFSIGPVPFCQEYF